MGFSPKSITPSRSYRAGALRAAAVLVLALYSLKCVEGLFSEVELPLSEVLGSLP
jgi:hypothetical protein